MSISGQDLWDRLEDGMSMIRLLSDLSKDYGFEMYPYFCSATGQRIISDYNADGSLDYAFRAADGMWVRYGFGFPNRLLIFKS